VNEVFGVRAEDERHLDEVLVWLQVIRDVLWLIQDGEIGSAVTLLEETIARSYPPPVMRVRCVDCGQAFEWPGLAEAHQAKANHWAGIEEVERRWLRAA
jgi:hypothetical protein